MTETLDLGLMPAQWFPDIELESLTVEGRSVNIVGEGEWALQGDLVLFEGRGTLTLNLNDEPNIEIWNGSEWEAFPADLLKHTTIVTYLQYDKVDKQVVVNARVGDKGAKAHIQGTLSSVEWLQE
ncbi:hypothetical protein [uncultured Marinobacter sp.]|uniref:hypothetical protein n=1 Tax=uncultured Marinobacter sp. TaxID=187379 RepID=UPI002629810A|nr:hypothetical protein [uncultured Marinobacter sp.]